jgi:hypothetical protein
MSKNIELDKPWKENLASFLKEPTRQNLRYLLQLEAIEDNDLEFKSELIAFDLLAKHILAMSNKNGGAIVFGVDEIKANQFNPRGLSHGIDITDIEKKLEKYLPSKVPVNIVPVYFKEEENIDFKDKFFLIVIVKNDPKYVPFMALKSSENINRNLIYVRRNRASETANYDEIQEIINSRIDTEYSTTNERRLVEHLEELKELYNHIPKTVQIVISRTHPNSHSLELVSQIFREYSGKIEYETKPNPNYPKESYEEFINKLIEIKKKKIIQILNKS